MPDLPRVEVGRTYTPRDPLYSHEGVEVTPIVVSAAGANDGGSGTGYEYEIRAGNMMGRITATGLYRPCTRTTVATGESATSATITVVDATAFGVGDLISVGSDTGKEIISIDYDGNEITVDGSAFAHLENEAVVGEDGSQTCRGVLMDFVKLKNDDNTVDLNKSANLIIEGHVNSDMLIGDVAAIRADTTSAGLLKGIKFSDDYHG